jgi:hypothetical protein
MLIKPLDKDEWQLISKNNNSIKYPQGNYRLRLIECIRNKKDSTEFEFEVNSKIYAVSLNLDISISTTARMSMVKNKVTKSNDTTYVNQITLYQFEPKPKGVKIIPLKDSNIKFLVKNETSESLYGLGDSTMFYGILFKEVEGGWNYRGLDISSLRQSYCLKPGESHIAGTNEMQKDKRFDISFGAYLYSLNLSKMPIELSFKAIDGERNSSENLFSEFFNSEPGDRKEGENVVKFHWGIRNIRYFNYSYGVKM